MLRIYLKTVVATLFAAALAAPSMAFARDELKRSLGGREIGLTQCKAVERDVHRDVPILLDAREGDDGLVSQAAGIWERLAGDDAYGTMQSIVEWGGVFAPEGVRAVMLTTGDGYHDALSASGIAGLAGAPVLITPSGYLGAQARAEIEWLQPERVIVVGGELSVSESVLNEVRALGPTVSRVHGTNAVDTAVAVFRDGAGFWGKTAFVAASTGYWDALAAAPLSYWGKAPIFLAEADGTLGQGTVDAIAEGGFENVLIAGGPMSVSDVVFDQLPGIRVERIYGDTAIVTSSELASFGIAAGMSFDVVAVASTNSYHDALTGAALAGRIGAPLILVGQYGGTRSFLDLTLSGMAPSGGLVFGGPLSVSEENYSYLSNGTPILPEAFVGTWRAVESPLDSRDVFAGWNASGLTDDLVIGADGTYREDDVYSDDVIHEEGYWVADGPDSILLYYFTDVEGVRYEYTTATMVGGELVRGGTNGSILTYARVDGLSPAPTPVAPEPQPAG